MPFQVARYAIAIRLPETLLFEAKLVQILSDKYISIS